MIKKTGKIINKGAILDDDVEIPFGKRYVYSGTDFRELSPEVMTKFNSEIIYASFSDFVVGLNASGLALSCISSFDDVKRTVLVGSIALGKIVVSFTKSINKKM